MIFRNPRIKLNYSLMYKIYFDKHKQIVAGFSAVKFHSRVARGWYRNSSKYVEMVFAGFDSLSRSSDENT